MYQIYFQNIKLPHENFYNNLNGPSFNLVDMSCGCGLVLD